MKLQQSGVQSLGDTMAKAGATVLATLTHVLTCGHQINQRKCSLLFKVASVCRPCLFLLQPTGREISAEVTRPILPRDVATHRLCYVIIVKQCRPQLMHINISQLT